MPERMAYEMNHRTIDECDNRLRGGIPLRVDQVMALSELGIDASGVAQESDDEGYAEGEDGLDLDDDGPDFDDDDTDDDGDDLFPTIDSDL